MQKLKLLFKLCERLLAILGCIFLVYHSLFHLSVITSPSMAPTLQGTSIENGDWVISQKITYLYRDPKRWEIVHFYDDETGIPVMKRVVGMPGEKISNVNRDININGVPLKRPEHLKDLIYYGYGKLRSRKVVDCGAGYFVLGDDSKDSHDSRYIGPVDSSIFLGRAWMIIWPLDRIQFLSD